MTPASSASPSGPGTGQGLWANRALSEQHGWTLIWSPGLNCIPGFAAAGEWCGGRRPTGVPLALRSKPHESRAPSVGLSFGNTCPGGDAPRAWAGGPAPLVASCAAGAGRGLPAPDPPGAPPDPRASRCAGRPLAPAASAGGKASDKTRPNRAAEDR